MMRTFLAGGLAAMVLVAGALVAGAAAREPAPDEPAHNVDIQFSGFCPASHPPRFYPREAASMGVSGDVELDCALDAAGDFAACKIVRERPRGWRFGEAALQIACAYRRPPAGEATGDRYTLKVPFKLR
jgi:TonB family protein